MAQQQAAAAALPRRAPKKQIHKAVSKKRKFVKDGVFYAELNDFLGNELSEQGYAGCEVRVTPQRTEIIIRATNSAEVIGDNGRRIRELTALIQKRFKFPKTGLICFAEKVRNKGFSALTQAQAVKYRLLTGLTVRRAAYSCLKYIMDSEKKNGALGCEIIVSGKLRGQRAKGMKFRDGLMIHSGDAANYYIDQAVKHVHLPQGVIGIKVKIMKPYDATGRDGVSVVLPDSIIILEPKDESLGRDDINQDRNDMADHLRNFQRPTGGGGGAGGAQGGMGGAPTQPQPPQQPKPPQQPVPPQGGASFNAGGYATQPQQPVAPVMDQPPQYPSMEQGGQYGAQPVQQEFAQGGGGAQQYNAAPTQQFDQYGAPAAQPAQPAAGGQQFQQFDNQYNQPMQSQQYPPAQQQPQPQQFGNQAQPPQQQQYYDNQQGGQSRQQNYQY